jgi:hypothetical protein
MAWAAVVGGVVALGSAYMQGEAGEDAADAQQRGLNAATAESNRRYDQVRNDLAPYLDNGGWASGQQRNYLSGDMSGFIDSAGYQAALRQGTAQLDAGATANGNLWGGGADADRIQFGQDTAWRFGSEYFNQLGGVANQGLNAGATLGSFGTQAGQQAGQNAIAGGQVQASAYANQANAWGNALQGLGGAFGQWAGNRNPGGG